MMKKKDEVRKLNNIKNEIIIEKEDDEYGDEGDSYDD